MVLIMLETDQKIIIHCSAYYDNTLMTALAKNK